jgi:hypothetical protein
MHPQLGAQLAPLRIKKNGATKGIELTPSLKLSVSNTISSAARPLLFLITYEINILLTHFIIVLEIKLGAQLLIAP